MSVRICNLAQQFQVSEQIAGTISFAVNQRHTSSHQIIKKHLPGSFDLYSLRIITKYTKYYTDVPVDPDSQESIEAWTTMIHEWVHFMQYGSSTLGLLISMNRIRQLNALIKLSRSIKKRMKKPVLYIPILKAIEQKVYPQELLPALIFFIQEWFTAEWKLLSNQGIVIDSEGKPLYYTLFPELINHISNTACYAREPITLAHIIEPIAIGCEGQWLINNLGEERAEFEQLRKMPNDLVSKLLPMVESELGINYQTRLILHDLALMPPVEYISSGKQATSERYTPTSRLIAALELIADGKVSQVPDSEADSYVGLASAIGKELDWPAPTELLKGALEYATWCKLNILNATPEEKVLIQTFDDFIRAFDIRLKQPDAFVCLTPACVALYESGWQPIWELPDGWSYYKGQPSDQATSRVTLMMTNQVMEAFVLGGTWECPLRNQCESISPGSQRFPSAGPKFDACHCRNAVQYATGGFFDPEKIISLE